MNSIIIPTDLKNLIKSFVEKCKICERLDNNIPGVVKYLCDSKCELCDVPICDLCDDCVCLEYHEIH